MLADMIGLQRAGLPVEVPHRLLDYEFIRRYSDGPVRPD